MMIGEKNKNTVKEFFKLIEAGDAKGVADLYSEDGVQRNPYASGIFPEGVQGKADIEAYWAGPIANFDGMTFPINAIYAMEDPSIVFVDFIGEIKLKDGAGIYANDYYATFKFNEAGQLVEYVEIFNPITAARGFGLLDQIK